MALTAEQFAAGEPHWGQRRPDGTLTDEAIRAANRFWAQSDRAIAPDWLRAGRALLRERARTRRDGGAA